jgi:hypothetical protein
VGSDAPQTKQEELSEKIAEQVKSDDQFDGVDVGTEVSSGTDDWGSWG